MAERKNPEQFFCPSDGFDAEKFADQDLLIRQGRCPNGHGLLEPAEYGQRCSTCGFATNVAAETDSVN